MKIPRTVRDKGARTPTGGAPKVGRPFLGPSRMAGHEVSRYRVHARCVRSQAPAANGSRSYFHRRHKDEKCLLNGSGQAEERFDRMDQRIRANPWNPWPKKPAADSTETSPQNAGGRPNGS